MKNIKALTLAFLIAIFSSSYALAEMAIGISGAIADIEAGGKETEGSEVTNGEADNQVGVVSVFVEYTPAMLGGVTLGFDYIPGSADVSSDTKSRTDTETSVTGTTTETTTEKEENEIIDETNYWRKLKKFSTSSNSKNKTYHWRSFPILSNQRSGGTKFYFCFLVHEIVCV